MLICHPLIILYRGLSGQVRVDNNVEARISPNTSLHSGRGRPPNVNVGSPNNFTRLLCPVVRIAKQTEHA